MSKKSLQEWYNQKSVTPHEKENLNKIGIENNSPKFNLASLKKIIHCTDIASKEKQINHKFPNQIQQITFLTPNFNANQTYAIVIDDKNDVWVIANQPFSPNLGLDSDLMVIKVWSCSNFNEAEEKAFISEKQLNSTNPILATATDYRLRNKIHFKNIITLPYVLQKNLTLAEINDNPDNFIKPLDIIRINKNESQFIIYFGQGQICNYTKEKGTNFSTWQDFIANFNSNIIITWFHPLVPFKKRETVIKHIAKAVNSNFGQGTKGFLDQTGYNWTYRNDEHFVNRCIYGIDFSGKVSVDSDRKFNLQAEIKENSEKFDNLTFSDISREVNCIESWIRETNHIQQIEQEKFEERIEVRPKVDCRMQ